MWGRQGVPQSNKSDKLNECPKSPATLAWSTPRSSAGNARSHAKPFLGPIICVAAANVCKDGNAHE
jgi:hypothetical protein